MPHASSYPRISTHDAAQVAFVAPESVEKPADIMEGAGAWPGEWTVERDTAHQRTKVIWKGQTSVSYPWGRFDHSERLTYDVDDQHPDTARVRGDSDYNQVTPGHLLTWRGCLELSSDLHTFFYKYTRTLLRDGQVLRTRVWEEPIPRDHQ